MTQDETVKQLSTQQNKAIAALLENGSVTAAAAAVGCRRGTIYRWMKDPQFSAELRSAELRAIEDLGRGLVGLGDDVRSTFKRAMNSDDSPWSVRVRAANAAAVHILRYKELIDLEQRLTDLEARL